MPNHPDRIYTPSKGALAVSRLRQVDGSGYTDPLTAAALNIGLDTTDDVLVSFMPEYDVMGNAGKLSGSQWADAWFQGSIKQGELGIKFEQLKPHEFLWALAYWCSDVDAAAQVGTGEGFRHQMRYRAETQKRQHLFTACTRLGPEASGLMKLLMYGCMMNTFELEVDREANFVTLDTKSKVPGKYKTNVFRERILGNAQDTSLTLDAMAVEGSSAQTRLDSILGVKADIEGDGLSSEEIACTAASDATPAVLTIEKANAKFRKVYTLISGKPADHGNGQTNFVIALAASTDEWLIGSYKQFNHLTYTSSVANAEAQTMGIKYFKNDGTWASVADLVDGTESGGATLAQTGTIHFNMPTDWQRTRMGHELLDDPKFSQMYWIKIQATGALTSTTAGTIAISTYEDIYKLYFSDNAVFSDVTTAAKSATGSNFLNAITITTAQDTMYLGLQYGYSRGARFLLDATKNAVVCTTTAKYYNGSAWVDLSVAHNFSDGTASGGAPLAQNGDMTWDQITDGQPTTINSLSAYWIALTWDSSLTANIDFQCAMMINRNIDYSVFFRGKESDNFTEGDIWPDPITDEESFNPGSTTLLEGGTFDSTNEVIKNGHNMGCQINNIKLSGNHNLSDAKHCVDGSGDKYAKRPVESAEPFATLTVEYEGDTPRWWLQHEHLNQGSLADTEDVRRFCMGLILTVPIPIDGYATDDTYPQIEISLPYCCLKTAPIGNADNEHICTVTYEVGTDNTNSLRPIYINGVSTDSSSYAQAA